MGYYDTALGEFTSGYTAFCQRKLLAAALYHPDVGVIEWAVERAGAEAIFDIERGDSFLEVIDRLWSTDESVRLANLAMARPDLLDYDELRIWETIKASPDLWSTSGQLLYSTLQEEWDGLLEHVEQHRLSRAVKPYLIL